MRAKQARQTRSAAKPRRRREELSSPTCRARSGMAHSAEIDGRVQHSLRELSPLERAAFTLRHHEG